MGHAAQLIADYRERWVPPDEGPLLGATPPAGSALALDHKALDRQLRLRRLMDRG